jgi:adenosylmethionine-8-amino-7-oxononanoate aminotransferase
MCEIADETGVLENVRGIGAITAADMCIDGMARAGLQVHQSAMLRGVLLRPLGNTIYWLPPFIISQNELHELKMTTRDVLHDVFGKRRVC